MYIESGMLDKSAITERLAQIDTRVVDTCECTGEFTCNYDHVTVRVKELMDPEAALIIHAQVSAYSEAIADLKSTGNVTRLSASLIQPSPVSDGDVMCEGDRQKGRPSLLSMTRYLSRCLKHVR